MKLKKSIPIFIFVLFLYSVFLLGRLGYIYQLDLMKPQIQNIEEINPKICLININEFNANHIQGNINFANSRFVYKDKISLTDENGNFEIVK